LVATRKKAKFDKSLDKKEAIDMEQGILPLVEALSSEEHRKKVVEDARQVGFASKDSKEITNDVVLESLNTFCTKEVMRKVAKEATIMDMDGEPVPEAIILESA